MTLLKISPRERNLSLSKSLFVFHQKISFNEIWKNILSPPPRSIRFWKHPKFYKKKFFFDLAIDDYCICSQYGAQVETQSCYMIWIFKAYN